MGVWAIILNVESGWQTDGGWWWGLWNNTTLSIRFSTELKPPTTATFVISAHTNDFTTITTAAAAAAANLLE